MRSRLLCLLLVSALALSFGGDAQGCDCDGPTFHEAFARSKAVFIGKVVRKHPNPNDFFAKYEFEIRKAWKGPVEGRIEILSPAGEGACGFPFVVDRLYLVYAMDVHGELQTGICTRTCSADAAFRDFGDLERAAGPIDSTVLAFAVLTPLAFVGGLLIGRSLVRGRSVDH